MKIILILLFASLSAFAQAVVTTSVSVDPSALSTSIISYQGTVPGGAVSSQIKIVRNPARIVDTSLSGIALPILTAITGSTSSQSANISTTAGIPPNGSVLFTYLLLDAGLSTQEVVQLVAISDSTHFTGIIRNNHTTSGTVRVIYSSFSQFLDPTWDSIGSGGLTNVGFIRMDPRPPNVFDQYRISAFSSGACTYVQDQSIPWAVDATTSAYATTPQYSTGSLSGTGNPTNAIVIDAGPTSHPGPIHLPCVQVQYLFTSSSEQPTTGISFDYFWDN